MWARALTTPSHRRDPGVGRECCAIELDRFSGHFESNVRPFGVNKIFQLRPAKGFGFEKARQERIARLVRCSGSRTDEYLITWMPASLAKAAKAWHAV